MSLFAKIQEGRDDCTHWTSDVSQTNTPVCFASPPRRQLSSGEASASSDASLSPSYRYVGCRSLTARGMRGYALTSAAMSHALCDTHCRTQVPPQDRSELRGKCDVKRMIERAGSCVLHDLTTHSPFCHCRALRTSACRGIAASAVPARRLRTRPRYPETRRRLRAHTRVAAT